MSLFCSANITRNRKAKVVILASNKQTAQRIRDILTTNLAAIDVRLASTSDECISALSQGGSTILLCSPRMFSLLSVTQVDSVDMLIAYDLHLLDAVYEMCLSQDLSGTRVVAFSYPLHSSTDVAAWLGCPVEHTYGFPPTVRASPLDMSVEVFTAAQPSAAIRSLIKPVYQYIHTAHTATLCFVPASHQVKSTASALMKQLGSDLDTEAFVGDVETLEAYAQGIRDTVTAECLLHGIAVLHDRLAKHEHRLMLRLFATGAARVLVASSDLAWQPGVRAPLVIIMGTQYMSVDQDSNPVLDSHDTTEILQMQQCAVNDSGVPRCILMCQSAEAELYSRFMRDGLLLESQLLDASVLRIVVFDAYCSGQSSERARSALLQQLSKTLLARRVCSNPAYYGAEGTTQHHRNLFISRLVDEQLDTLCKLGCLRKAANAYSPTKLSELIQRGDVELEVLAKVQKESLESSLRTLHPPEQPNGVVEEVKDDALEEFVSRLGRLMDRILMPRLPAPKTAKSAER